MTRWARLLSVFAVACLAPHAVGCAAAARHELRPQEASMRFVDGEGRPTTFEDVVARARAAEVVLLGEMHGHPAGLALAARLFEEVAAAAPRAALSLEFAERDQQEAIDAFAAGAIDEEELTRRRNGARLPDAHAAMIRAAAARSLPVLAANAPRRFAKQARTEGWDALRALPDAERALFVIPDGPPPGDYEARFAEAMGMPGHGPSDAEKLAAYFRAQLLWDATMADSIARALAGGRAPVVQVVGRFHVEHEGGLVHFVRRARPDTRIFTVVFAEAPTEQDRGRADVVAFVGAAPDGG